jgi:pantothenate kinase
MAMVGENVALLAGSFSLWLGVDPLVFGGSTLAGNPALVEALDDYVGRFGRRAVHLADGAFAGALGARLLAATP